jgi:hypothetical protein
MYYTSKNISFLPKVKSKNCGFVNDWQNRPACNGKRPVTKITSRFLFRNLQKKVTIDEVLT